MANKKKNPDAVRLAALRMKKMTPAQRSEVARKGGRARMKKATAEMRSHMASLGTPARMDRTRLRLSRLRRKARP
jgi:hypothetical protein